MSIRMLIASLTLAVVLLTSPFVQGAMIPKAITGVTGKAFQVGDSADPGNGSISRVLNGTGLTVGNVNTPATWTHDNAWQNNWQGNGTFNTGNSTERPTPGAWFVADLGSSYTNLDDVAIWNVREVADRAVKNVDLYYAVSPTAAPVTGGAYNFASGGWTLLGNYTIAQGNAAIDSTIDLSGVPNARYIGFNMLTNYGSTFRTGFAEIQFTALDIPEPATATLGLLSLGGLLLRRRRTA